MKTPETKEDAIKLWYEANSQQGCTCFISPPCSFCVDGFSLPLDEYLELLNFEGIENDE